MRSYTPVVPSKTILDSRPKWAKCITVYRPKRHKHCTRRYERKLKFATDIVFTDKCFCTLSVIIPIGSHNLLLWPDPLDDGLLTRPYSPTPTPTPPHFISCFCVSDSECIVFALSGNIFLLKRILLKRTLDTLVSRSWLVTVASCLQQFPRISCP